MKNLRNPEVAKAFGQQLNALLREHGIDSAAVIATEATDEPGRQNTYIMGVGNRTPFIDGVVSGIAAAVAEMPSAVQMDLPHTKTWVN